MVFVDEREGLEVMLLRLRLVSEGFGCEAEIVPGSIRVRVERDRAAEGLGRLRMSSLLVIHPPEMVGNLGIGWRPRRGPLQRLLRLAIPPKEIERPGLHLQGRQVLGILV